MLAASIWNLKWNEYKLQKWKYRGIADFKSTEIAGCYGDIQFLGCKSELINLYTGLCAGIRTVVKTWHTEVLKLFPDEKIGYQDLN